MRDEYVQSKLAVSLVPEYYSDGREAHTYWGAFHPWNLRFVKSFDVKKQDIEFTTDENDALFFVDDGLCTECMEVLIEKYKAFTISIWHYGRPSKHLYGLSTEIELQSEIVAYPNEHWWKNGNLMPSLMHRSIDEFYEEKEKTEASTIY
jgi:hypothetical protein